MFIYEIVVGALHRILLRTTDLNVLWY